MCRSLAKVKWNNLSHALSAFLTVMIMPLTYSIAYGLIAGICSFIITEGTFLALSYVGIPKPVFDMDEEEEVAATMNNEDGPQTKDPTEGDAVSSDGEEVNKSTDAEA